MKKLSLNLLFFILLSSCSQQAGFQSLSSLSENNLFSSGKETSKKLSMDQKEVESFQLRSHQTSVDFLVMPDSSKSMLHRLENLGPSLSDLLYVISDYDWQMGLSSVDHGDYKPKFRYQADWREHVSQGRGHFGTLMNLENGSRFLSEKILNPRMPDYENVFLHSLSHISKINCSRPPFCSNPVEQPLRSLKSAIERAFLDNRALFRSSSEYFISILATNEGERKEDSKRATTAEEVISAFNRQFQNSNKQFLHYSIVISDEDCLRKEKKQNLSAGISYASIELSKKTAGTGAVMSLCNENYGSGLRTISQHIKNKVENSFFLKKTPVPDSVELHFSKGPQVSWSLRGREILFDDKNFENIEGTVSYQALK